MKDCRYRYICMVYHLLRETKTLGNQKQWALGKDEDYLGVGHFQKYKEENCNHQGPRHHGCLLVLVCRHLVASNIVLGTARKQTKRDHARLPELVAEIEPMSSTKEIVRRRSRGQCHNRFAKRTQKMRAGKALCVG